MRGRVYTLLAVGACWWAFGREGEPTDSATPDYAHAAADPAADGAAYPEDEGSDDANAESPALGGSTEVLGSETYAEYDARRDALDGAAGEYEGDGCTVDCGGHEAGRRWAELRGVTDESECGGRSWSFREGCVTYAREQSQSGEAWGADGE